MKQSCLKDIDLSTTYFKVHPLTEDCLMQEYAAKHYAHYQPQSGWGYYHIKSEELRSIKRHKKLILMDEVCTQVNYKLKYYHNHSPPHFSQAGSIPKYAIVSSAIKLSTNKGWKDVFVQEIGWQRKLTAGSIFLFCKYNNIILMLMT